MYGLLPHTGLVVWLNTLVLLVLVVSSTYVLHSAASISSTYVLNSAGSISSTYVLNSAGSISSTTSVIY